MTDIERELRQCADAHGDSATSWTLLRGADALAAANARIGELEAALPRTADGMVIVPGMQVWDRDLIPGVVVTIGVLYIAVATSIDPCRYISPRPDDWYSTRAAALAAPIQPEPVSRSATKRVNLLTGMPMMDGLVPKLGTPEWDAARAAHNADPATRHATPFRTAGPMAANQDATDLAREDA